MSEFVLNFNASDKQKNALRFLFDDIITDLWYWGGAGWWKSYIWVAWQWMMCMKYPWVRGFFWREELKRLKQTTLASYFKFLDDYDIPEELKGKYNSQDSVIRFSNWSEILLLNLERKPSDPLYLRFWSLELTFWFIDEANEVDEQCITILSTRIGRQNNEKYNIKPKLLQTFNPDKGHVYRKFYKPKKDWTLPEYREFIPALVTDNPYIAQSYIDQLKKSDEVTRQRLLYGNFEYDNTPGRLYEYDALNDMLTNDWDDWDMYISADIARKGKYKEVIFVWKGFKIVDHYEFEVCELVDIEDKIKEFARNNRIGMSRVIVDEDGVGWWVVDHLRCKGFINNSTQITTWAGKKNFKNLKTQCYFALQSPINERRMSIPEEISAPLIEELDAIVEINLDNDWKKEIIKKSDIKDKIGRSPDYADAFMMRMYFNVVGQDNPERSKKRVVIPNWI